MLEVVQHEQRRGLAEGRHEHRLRRVAGGLRESHGEHDGAGHPPWIGKTGQGDEPDAIGELGDQVSGNVERQSRLADPARAGQGEEAKFRPAEKVTGDRRLPLATDERRDRVRQLGSRAWLVVEKSRRRCP